MKFGEKIIQNWDQLIEFYQSSEISKGAWIFRGQERSNWGFQTSIERAVLDFAIDKADNSHSSEDPLGRARRALKAGVDQESVFDIEKCLIRRFQRQYHHFATHVPEKHNIMEWIAFMQHYGAPTRLLDWSYSFFAGVYFAVERAKSECAVWALNTEWIMSRVKDVLKNNWRLLKNDLNAEKKATFDGVFFHRPPRKLVLHLNPYRLNERLVIQQGIFLCPGDISVPFEDNVTELQSRDSESNAKKNLIKVRINCEVIEKRRILQNLHRMNMNRASLFPGLDGFAQSLRTLIAFPTILQPWRESRKGQGQTTAKTRAKKAVMERTKR